MSKQILFAVVGCGYIGKRHASMILGNSHCKLVGLVDSQPKSGLGFDAPLQAVPFFSTLAELFQSGLHVDVVAVASPNGCHEDHALEAIENHCHVVIEKPMALTKVGCEKIIFKALQRHKQVFCVMQNRYSPPSVWLKELLDSGKLGKVFIVQVNCFWNRDERYYKPDKETGRPTGWHGTDSLDAGTLFTQFSHFIDLMYWYFGDISDISARLRDFNHQVMTDFEDSGFINFNFVDGGVGAISYSTAVWDKNLESSITVIAELGSLKVGGQYMNEVEYCHIKDYVMPTLAPANPPNDYGPYKGSAANHHYIYENIVDVLDGKTPITTNALEGLKVVDIIERVYAKGR
jgi:UDP-N-acetyl-2-amino-2-deoxyglucuronate dehydrogenase